MSLGVSIFICFITYWCHIYSCNIYLFKVLFSLLKLKKYLPTPIQYTEEISSVRYLLILAWPFLLFKNNYLFFQLPTSCASINMSISAKSGPSHLQITVLIFLFQHFFTHFRILCSLWGTHYWIHTLNYIFPYGPIHQEHIYPNLLMCGVSLWNPVL